MASDDRFWTKKLIVWNISQQCSTDHLVNYLEVMTKKIVVENGVEYFQNISHAALVTLTEPLTDTDLAAAQSQCDRELLEDSNVILISISEPPMAILVHNEKSQLSHDNIFYYFDSCVSGCDEGSVVSCEMFPLLGLAVVTFKSSTVAKAALARKEHSPDNVSTILVEPCYNDFHMTLLQELNSRALADCKVPVPSTFMDSKTSSICKPLSAPSDNVLANKLSGSDTPTKTELVLATSSHSSSPLFPKVSEVTLLSTVTSTTPSNKLWAGPMPQQIHNQKPGNNDIFPAGQAGFSSAQLSLRCAEENIEEFEYLTLNKDYVGKTSVEKCEMLNSDWTELDCKTYGRGLEESKEFPGQMQGAHQWKDKHGQTNCFSRTLNKSELTENFDDLTPKYGRKMDMDQNDDTVICHSASLNQLEDFSCFDTQMPDFFQQRYDTVLETGSHEGRGMLASYHGFIHEPESSSSLEQSSSDRLLSVASETASLDTLNNWESQELARQRVENQVFFKSQKVMTIKVPAYCLRLLTDFCTENHGCKLTILEKQDMVEFNGTEEDCENAKSKLLECIQNLEKDSLQLSPPFGMMLQTVKGQQYLEKLHQVHPNCSVTIDVNCIKCAAHNSKDVAVLLEDIKKDLYQETLMVQSRCFTSTHFMELKSQLEKEHVVHISINNFTGQLLIAGIKGSDGMAVKVLQNFCKQFQACNNEFVIPGLLADRACSQWYISQLDRVKELIIANGGTVKQLSNTNGYSLKFECPKDIKKELQTNLNDIKSQITSCTTTVDLTSKFTSYSDRALVINGLNAMGIEQFCVGFEQTLKKQGVDCFLGINLPPRCPLPKCYLTRACGKRDSQQIRQEKHGAVGKSSHKRRTHHHINTGRPSPFKPVSLTLGTTRITIKCGDITSENVNVLVSIVAEDLQMKNTAVGAAFLKKYPEAEQELNNAVSEEDDVNKVIITRISPQNFRGRKGFTASYLFHVIIGQWPPQSVHTRVKVLVQKCLQKAVEARQISIAFPPLGIGKRFKLPKDVVANAMLAGTQEFLQTSPDLLQSITFVLYEHEVAATFKDVLHRKTALGNAIGLNVSGNESASDKNSNIEDSNGSNSSSEDSDDDSDDDSESEDDLPFIDFPQKETEDQGIHTTSADNFIASLCTRIETDITTVHDKLLAEIRKVFLYKDTVQDKTTLKKLRPKDCEEIEKTAVDCGVLIKWLDKGEKMEVCGRDHEVSNIILIVRNKLLEIRTLHAEKQIVKQQKSTGHFSYSLHPPTYWKIHEKSMFNGVQELVFNKIKYGKLIKVNDLERKSVIKLVHATWNSKLVGTGKDGANLHHKNIEVIKVKRLEDPSQWEAYSFVRQKMLRNLNSEPNKKSCCTPIENLKGSSGPIKTTHIIPKHSPLCREMYPEFRQPSQKSREAGPLAEFEARANITKTKVPDKHGVNEHYLFHGFKKEFKKAIVNHGLDSRLASDNAMLGRGLYASESSTKADQYTDSKTSRTKGDKMMILMRVLLGTPYLSTSQNPYKFSRPPCKKCFKDKCACPNSTHFDSVIDNYDKRNFREFVVYQGCQCYPEYFIVYNRV